jgi:hypothetical protein
MPVFVNEVIITGQIGARDRSAPAAAAAPPAVPLDGVAREQLVEEVSGEVFRRLERALDRLTER